VRRLALVLACAACKPGAVAHDARTDAAIADAAPDPVRDAPAGDAEDPVVTLIRELARELADHKVGASDLAARLGTRSPAKDRAIHVAPTDARLADAQLVRGPSGRLAQVRLELAQPVALGELRRAFGDYEVDARGEPLAAWPVAFVRAVRGRAASVSLFVDVVRRDPIELQATTHVTLQLAAP
jgi:hypothetical protein